MNIDDILRQMESPEPCYTQKEVDAIRRQHNITVTRLLAERDQLVQKIRVLTDRCIAQAERNDELHRNAP